MNTFLFVMFYLIPAILCWVSIYYYAKTLDKGDSLGEILFSILIVCSLIPGVNIIYAFIVSAIFILRKWK